jgi:hypothetical protein
VTAVGVVWIFLPLFRPDPDRDDSWLPVPRTAVLVLTNRAVRVYQYWGTVRPDLQELVHERPVTDVVAVADPVQRVTGQLAAWRVAIAFADGRILVADVPEGADVDAARVLIGTLRRQIASR